MIKKANVIRIDTMEERFNLKSGSLILFSETKGLTLYSVGGRLFVCPEAFNAWMNAKDRTELLKKYERKKYFLGGPVETTYKSLDESVRWFTEQLKKENQLKINEIF